MGMYDDGDSVVFMSFHLLYIDLLLEVTQYGSVTSPKYCDIDTTFGLHDYQVTVDLRNSQTSFINEVFRKVFTKVEFLESKWAVFELIQSESDARYYSESARFPGKPFYQWKSLIFNEKVGNLAILDLVIQDEFGEPFSYSC